jgi:rhodanese-related sulfurtransferase
MREIIVITFVGILASCSVQKKAFKEIDTAQMMELEQQANVVVLDVRTPVEIADGYIVGTRLFIDYNNNQFKDEVAKLDKSKTYIVYCRSGNRSTKALNIMSELGFKKLYELEDGINGVANPELIIK